MRFWSYYPVWFIDLTGSVLMIILSLLCLKTSYKLYKREQDNALANHLLWFCMAIFAFSASRSIGHIIRHILYFLGYSHWWKNLSPISGSINTITFVVIASVTLFFHRMQNIMGRMIKDRQKIEQASLELLKINRDTGTVVSERTRAEMALRVAHEIRNPVTVIAGLLRRIATNAPECSPQKDTLQKIITQAEKLESLVQDFETMRPELEKIITVLDINQIMEESVEVVLPDANRKNIDLLSEPAHSHLVFRGNKDLVKIAVIHILHNAIDACTSDDKIKITTTLDKKGIIVKIEDTGPGIPKEILEHVFEPFYTTIRGKTGLGLAYVRQIIAEHKGDVAIKSVEGSGTSVEITIPTHLGELKR